jgi:transcriptional regulator with XRE-family HTH domain
MVALWHLQPKHNAGMPTYAEKASFSKRLELALRRSQGTDVGATELALRFNLCHTGTGVSAQTAHKWLSGRAIPASDKLATLATWLNVGALAALRALACQGRGGEGQGKQGSGPVG